MQYSEWLFDILFAMEKKIDFKGLSMTQNRILGFISEDLFSIYFLKQQENLRKKELQLIWFSNTTKKEQLLPAFSERVIPVILSSDNTYSIYMGVLIQSIIQHSSSQNNYDIIILHTDISKENQMLLKRLISGKNNFSIRFADISSQLNNRHFEVWAHYKKYNVYRLVAPEILKNYNKAIYFDSDIVVREDIASLYNIDIGKNLIAAVPDIRFHSWNNVDGNNIQNYSRTVLKLPDTHKYFNSGVLIYNLQEFRQEYTSDFLLDYCAQRQWMYIDQDVLNIVCSEKTFYLPMKWNCLITADNYETEKWAPLSMYQDYLSAHKNPFVVHYAGNFLPFRVPEVDLYWYFWEYAKNTPFYEILLARMIDTKLGGSILPPPPLSAQYYSKVRQWADKNMPKGTRRREFAKKILPKGSRRWNFFKKIYYLIFKG